jgi:hypothetical protein
MSPKSELLQDLVVRLSTHPEANNPEMPCDGFVGYGNPDARILVVANAANYFLRVAENNDALKAENLAHWQSYFKASKGNTAYKIAGTPEAYSNPIKPLVNLPFNRGEGKGLNSLQRILFHAGIVEDFQGKMLALDKVFFTEFVPIVERNTAGKITNLRDIRKTVLSHDFFKSFDVVILGIGTELFEADFNWLIDNFGFANPDHSERIEPNLTTFKQTLLFHKGIGPLQGKVLIHARRLSGGSSNDFFSTFGNLLKTMY